MNRSILSFLVLFLLLMAGCATIPANVTGAGTQLETRQIQTRTYDTLDKAMTMRSVIATLQDLGFTIDQADAELGTITATRLHEYTMRMTSLRSGQCPHRRKQRDGCRNLPGLLRRPRQGHVPDPEQGGLAPLFRTVAVACL